MRRNTRRGLLFCDVELSRESVSRLPPSPDSSWGAGICAHLGFPLVCSTSLDAGAHTGRMNEVIASVSEQLTRCPGSCEKTPGLPACDHFIPFVPTPTSCKLVTELPVVGLMRKEKEEGLQSLHTGSVLSRLVGPSPQRTDCMAPRQLGHRAHVQPAVHSPGPVPRGALFLIHTKMLSR